MSELIIVGLIGAASGMIGAIVPAILTSKRMATDTISKQQKDNHLLWMWNRKLVDQIYTQKPPPPAPPPEGLFK